MTWKYYNPVSIIYDNESINQIDKYIDQNKCSNILIVTYNWFKDSEYYKKLEKLLPDLYIWDNIEENPSLESCQKAIEYVQNKNIDLIISIGGGSVIDTAKVVRMAIINDVKKIEDLFDKSNKGANNRPYLIALPTTHGTGSEVTMWATVWDKKNMVKKSLSDSINYPDLAIYDINLVSTLPNDVALISTLDALSHAFEAIWNKNANPISTHYAIEAISLIVKNIECFSNKISNENRLDLIKASMMAGLSFSNTKTAAAHSISYPLTLYYNIPHGIACSITLGSLLEINIEKIENEFGIISKRTEYKSSVDIWDYLYKNISKIIKYKLSDYGMKISDIINIVPYCYNKDRMSNNISNLSEIQIESILTKNI